MFHVWLLLSGETCFDKVMLKAAKSQYTLKDGSAANFVGVRNLGGAVLTIFD